MQRPLRSPRIAEKKETEFRFSVACGQLRSAISAAFRSGIALLHALPSLIEFGDTRRRVRYVDDLYHLRFHGSLLRERVERQRAQEILS